MYPLFNLVVKKQKCSEEDDVVNNNPCQTYEDDTISAKDLEIRYNCLKFTWEPPVSFAFPVQLEGNRTSKFQHKYLQLFPWLAYSKDKQGAFCKWCVIFANSGGGPLGKLVKIPMVKYKHCLTDLKNHAKTDYHLLSAQRANDFLHNYETGNQKSVNVLLDNHNRIETGDSDLITHLETSKKNCTMISPTIQNEIVEAIRLVIQNKIVERVKTSKLYSILCDETTDVSTVEQFTLCVRYVDVPNCVILEDFLGFIKMESTTGIAIATANQNELENIGLTFENLCGQGYDGDSNMSGVNNGSKKQDLSKALADVTVVKESLEAVREDIVSYFKNIFNEVTSIATKVNVEIKTPRVCGRQTNRVNIQSSPEEYYHISIFIPFLDNILLQLQTRFNQQLKEVIAFEGLIPANFSAYNRYKYAYSILSAAPLYENALINLKAELTMW
ncbi:zinc finger MYM-type protein 1-like [Aphis craccivora]|uniref:Zinc finger MYM-type protein 1-like n=1 Tax=Aphis craccivora TaxID=307492 RepID=A0A6G0WE65_APHCR|nr:zinc finger MYM-type protein 1-like [Aphis craccivora]